MTRGLCRRLVFFCAGAFAFFLPVSIFGEQVSLIALGVALVVALVHARTPLRPLAFDAPVLLYMVAAATSVIASPLGLALSPQAFFFRTAAAYFLCSRALVFDGMDDVELRAAWAVGLCAVTAAAAGVLALVQFRSGFDLLAAIHLRAPIQSEAPGFPGRFAAIGFFHSRLAFAHMLLVPAGLLGGVVTLWRGSRARRAIVAAALLLVLCGLALSFGRMAWIGLALGVAVALLIVGGTRARVVVAAAGALALCSLALPAVRARVHSLGEIGSVQARGYVWSRAAEVISEYPLTGTGAGSYRRALDPLVEAAGPCPGFILAWCHNTFWTLLAENGPLALTAWLWLWGAFFVAPWRAFRGHAPGSLSRALAVGAVAAGVAITVVSLMHDIVVDGRASYAAFALCGLVAALEESATRRAA